MLRNLLLSLFFIICLAVVVLSGFTIQFYFYENWVNLSHMGVLQLLAAVLGGLIFAWYKITKKYSTLFSRILGYTYITLSGGVLVAIIIMFTYSILKYYINI